MKKALVVILAIVVIAGVLVAVYGSKHGWFGKKSEPVAAMPPTGAQKSPGASAEEVVSTQALLRLDAIRKATNQDFSKVLTDWAKAPGAERKVSWEAARLGVKSGEDRQARMRCCSLAAALAAGKPQGATQVPAADENAVEPLVECLKSGDAGVIQSAVNALGTINLHNPTYKVEAKALPEVKKLLTGEDPAAAASALSAVSFFGETGMAANVLVAWEKHGKAPGFAEKARDNLKILMELRLREKLGKEHADWPRDKCLAEAKPKAQALSGEFGTDLAKWKSWWMPQTLGVLPALK